MTETYQSHSWENQCHGSLLVDCSGHGLSYLGSGPVTREEVGEQMRIRSAIRTPIGDAHYLGPQAGHRIAVFTVRSSYVKGGIKSTTELDRFHTGGAVAHGTHFIDDHLRD